jgi:hypothetical protein
MGWLAIMDNHTSVHGFEDLEKERNKMLMHAWDSYYNRHDFQLQRLNKLSGQNFQTVQDYEENMIRQSRLSSENGIKFRLYTRKK